MSYTGPSGTAADTYNGEFDNSTVVIKDADGNNVTDKFAVTLTRGSLTIKKRAITITAGSARKVYDTTPLTKNTYEITSDMELAAEQDIASISITGIQTEVGTSYNTPSNAVIKDSTGADVTSNYAIDYQNGILEVVIDSGATITAAAYDGTYDGQEHGGITGVVLKNSKGEEIQILGAAGWTITYQYKGTSYNTNPKFTDAGEYPIIVVAENSNYGTLTAVSVTAQIHPKKVTLTSRSATQVYNGNALTAGADTPVGFVDGEGVEITTTGSQLNVGSSVNTFTYKENSGTKLSNYEIDYKPGTLTVTPITNKITITANSDHKTYDGTALTNSGYTYTDGILVSGDVLTAVVAGSQTDADSSANRVVSYKVIQGDTDVTANYTFATSVDGLLTVEKRPVSLSSSNLSKTYNGTALTAGKDTVTVDNFVDGEGVEVTMTGSQTEEGSSPNSFKWTEKSGTNLNNYTVSYQPGTLTVTKSSNAQMSVTGYSGMYDGDSHGVTVTPVEGTFVAGTQWTYQYSVDDGEYSSVEPTFTDVGTHTVTVKASNKNYVDVYESAEVIITKRDVTLTSGSSSKPYDGTPLTNSTVTVGGSGFVNGEGAEYTVTGSRLDEGSSPNKFDYELKSNTKEGNYEIRVEYGTLTITKATDQLVVTANTAKKTYDGSALTDNGYTVNGGKLMTGDVLVATVEGSQTDAGSSDNMVTNVQITRDGVDVTGNYDIRTENGTLTVSRQKVTMESATDSKPYDGTPLTNHTVTAVGFIAGEGADYNVTGSQLDEGSSNNEFKYALKSNTKAGNYEIGDPVYGTLTVTPAENGIIVIAASESRMYDGTALTNAGYKVVGSLFSGDELTAVVDGTITDAGHADNVVKCHTITRGDTEITRNYRVSYQSGTLTVTPRSVTLVSATDSKYYDGNPLTNDTVTVDENSDGFVDGEGVTCNITGTQTTAGSSQNTFDETTPYEFNSNTKAQNYTITTREGTLTVFPVEADVIVTIKGNRLDVPYDSEEHTVTGYEVASISNPLYSAADFTFSGTAEAKGTEIGTYAMGLKASDFQNTNPNFKTVVFQIEDGALHILRKELTVSKTVNKTSAVIGDKLVYTIKVTNSGEVELTGITIKDQMLGIDKNIGTLAPGASWTESYTYTVQSSDVGKTIINTAIAKADDGTEGRGSSGGTEITWPSGDHDDNDSGDSKLNTIDHFSYIIGYKDGTLRPYGTITRGEVATIFFRLLTDEAREKYWSQTNDYSDCSSDLWCNNAISTLTNMGIISGFEDGTFRPYAMITRAQFAKIAVGFFETTTAEYQGYYTDVPEDAWFTDYVEAASRVGLIQGFEDNTFRPNTNITRAQACVIVNRALGRKPDMDHLLKVGQMITWPDNNPSDWFYADMQEATNSHDYTWMTVDGEAKAMEQWTTKLPQRDWAALEHAWSTAHSAPGGEVVTGK